MPSDYRARREALLEWLMWRPGRPRQVDAIARHSGLYTVEYRGRYGMRVFHNSDRCFDDLKALERQGRVRRLPGRPARWEVVADGR